MENWTKKEYMGCTKSVLYHPSHYEVIVPGLVHLDQLPKEYISKSIFCLQTDPSAAYTTKVTNRSGHSIYVCSLTPLHTDTRMLRGLSIVDTYFIKVRSGDSFMFGQMDLCHFQCGIYAMTCDKGFNDDFVIYKGLNISIK